MNSPRNATARYVLRAQRLFDGTEFIDDPAVLVEDGTVVAVGSDVPTDIETHDLGRVTLLPGLVDCHQHLVFDGNGGLEDQVSDRTDEELRIRARASARNALLGGVTTLRDLGDRGFVTLDLRDAPDLPTILCSGPPITLVGGHCWYLGGECGDRDDLVAAVQARIARGCDVVKIMVTGGFLTPATPMWKSQFGPDELRLVVDEAHSAGLTVAAHCHGSEGIGHAVEAGIDTIEHCTFLDESMQVSPDEELLERLAGSTTTVSATMGTTPGAVLPETIGQIMPSVIAAQSRARSLGGRIVVGTDAGISPFKPHDVARHAIHDLLAIGMSPVGALRALTLDGADALGLPTKGRLAARADADMVAVAGDPEHEPEALSRVVQVWRAGKPVERQPTESI
jgi:imidazolonepropionase-like amidohydrolase